MYHQLTLVSAFTLLYFVFWLVIVAVTFACCLTSFELKRKIQAYFYSQCDTTTMRHRILKNPVQEVSFQYGQCWPKEAKLS